jgi:hypothetical protein
VDDLPQVWEVIHRKPNEPLMDTAIHPARSYRWAWWAAGGFVGFAGLAGLGWRVRAARRAAAGGVT